MIRIGTSGWKYKDWDGIVYPKPKPRGFDELAFLSRFFDAIEINTSYYGPPRPSAAKKWADCVAANPAFRFTAKLYHSFTHERRPAPTDEMDFKDGLAPLVESGRFGALLMQFPWSFKNSPADREYLITLANRFREYPLVLEVRHASWNQPEILDLLGELGLGLCNIDQPLFHRSIRPGAQATSPLGYIRLHGRNYKAWFDEKADVRERYDYLYPVRELEPWVDRIKEVATKTEEVYVMSNNHNLGKAVVNALEITSLLKSERVDAPELLVEKYPELAGLVKSTQAAPPESA
jgi:uncharacterized protein YecE (DUF72 family)